MLAMWLMEKKRPFMPVGKRKNILSTDERK
jgi:hypothetical protein